jgi:hypothetical protein
MKTSLKTAFCTVLLLCLVGSVLTGCTQMGDEQARDLNDMNGMGTQYQGYRNNLVGGRYGNNMTGTDGNNTAQNGLYGGNMMGNNRWSIARDGTVSNSPGNTAGLNNRTGNDMFGNTVDRLGGNNSQRASLIERQLENSGGIGDCVVLVNGDTALVGLRNTTGNAANMTGLRSNIERRVRQIDSSVRNVIVTDSQDVLTRMGRLGTAGNYNGMTANFADEFNDLIDRINGTMR